MQEQLNPSWADVIIAAATGLITASLGLLAIGWRLGSRDKQIDQAIGEAENELRNEQHALRIYVDEQDRLNRHEWVAILQRELAKTDTLIAKGFDRLTEKLEYHEKHDDIRFENLSNRIWGIELRNAARDGTLPPSAPKLPEAH